MSDQSQGPGWWLASDGRWYPPEQHPSAPPAAQRGQPSHPTGGRGSLGRYLVCAVISLLLIGGVAGFLVATQDGNGAISFDDDSGPEDDEQAELDELYDACDDGDMEACDDLYFEAPIGSDEEEFGSRCGDRRRETRGECE